MATEMLEQHACTHNFSQPVAPKNLLTRLRTMSFRMGQFYKGDKGDNMRRNEEKYLASKFESESDPFLEGDDLRSNGKAYLAPNFESESGPVLEEDDMRSNEKKCIAFEAKSGPSEIDPNISMLPKFASEGGSEPARKLEASAERPSTRCRTLRERLKKHENFSQLCTQVAKDLEDSKLMISVLDRMPRKCEALHEAAGGGVSAARLIKQEQESQARMSGGMLRLAAKSKSEFSGACTFAPPTLDTLPSLESILSCGNPQDVRFQDESDDGGANDEDMRLDKGHPVHTKEDLDCANGLPHLHVKHCRELTVSQMMEVLEVLQAPSFETLPGVDSVADDTGAGSFSDDRN